MNASMRVAIVGAGYFSQFHLDAWRRLDIRLVAICDKDLSKARRVADKFGIANAYQDLEQMLDSERPDLLDIVTTPPTHLALIRAAATRGIHAICQKPFTLGLAEAEEAVATATGAGTFLVVHENFRFQPWYGQIKQVLDEGRLGQPYQISFRLRPGDGQGPDAYLARQPYFQSMERFLVHETAIHLVDVFRFLLGEVRSVWAQLTRLNPAIAGEDAGIIVFEFTNHSRGVFDGNRLVDHPARNRRLTMGDLLLEGSAGVLRLDGDGRIFLRAFENNLEEELHYDWADRGFGGDSVYELQRQIVQHLTTGSTLANTAEDYLSNLRVEEAIYRSSASGARVSL
jgi:predicted dehydrogenase